MPSLCNISVHHPNVAKVRNAFVGQLLQLPELKKVASGYYNTRGAAMTAADDAPFDND